MSERIDAASRFIRAEASAIYQAFASPEAMESWLPPEGMTGRVHSFSFRDGGGYRMRLTYEDPGESSGKSSDDSDAVSVRFLTLVPDRRIEQVVEFESDQPQFAGSMKMTWALESAGQGTEVTVRCEHVPEGIRPDDHQAGLASTLENLARFAEAGGWSPPSAADRPPAAGESDPDPQV